MRKNLVGIVFTLRRLAAVAVVIVSITASAAAATPAHPCSHLLSGKVSELLQDAAPEVLDRAIKLIFAGAPALMAARLALHYPDMAARILEKSKEEEFEWIVLYRGISGSLNDHNPYYFRSTPGGNFWAPPVRFGVNQGIFASSDIDEARFYAQASLFAAEIGAGTMVELVLPRFLVTRHILKSTYYYIPRSNTPELDLWVTGYVEVTPLVQEIREGKGDETLKSFEEFYFSEARMKWVPSQFAKTMNSIYQLIRRLKSSII